MNQTESEFMTIKRKRKEENEFDANELTSVILTKQQESCVKYRGQARKDLVIRSAAGGGKSVVLVNRAREFLKEARQIKNKNSIAVFTHNHVLAQYLKEQIISDLVLKLSLMDTNKLRKRAAVISGIIELD